MQWDMKWLQLDGVVGGDMESLFCDIKVSVRKSSSGASSQLMDRLRILGRLGRKLMGHGVITRDTNLSYLAVSSVHESGANSPMVIWQASSDRLRSLEEQLYFGKAAASLLKLTVEPVFDDILTILTVGVTDPL